MAAGDILKVVFTTRLGVQLGLNVRHYQSVISLGAPISYATTALRFSAVFAFAYKELMSTEATFLGVCVQKLRPLPMLVEVCTANDVGPGVVLGEALPRQSAGLIRLKSAMAGRSGRGRAYIPFPGEADNTVGAVPTPGYGTRLAILAGLLGSAVDVTEGVNTEAWAPVVFHRTTGTADLIVATQVINLWHTQRRRGSLGAANPTSTLG